MLILVRLIEHMINYDWFSRSNSGVSQNIKPANGFINDNQESQIIYYEIPFRKDAVWCKITSYQAIRQKVHHCANFNCINAETEQFGASPSFVFLSQALWNQ